MGKILKPKVKRVGSIRDIKLMAAKERTKAMRLPSLSSDEYSVVSDHTMKPDIAPPTVQKVINLDEKQMNDVIRVV